MVVCVAAEHEAQVIEVLTSLGEQVLPIGEVVAGKGPAKVSYFRS